MANFAGLKGLKALRVSCQAAVGGNGAACTWVTGNVLQLRLGPEASEP